VVPEALGARTTWGACSGTPPGDPRDPRAQRDPRAPWSHYYALHTWHEAEIWEVMMISNAFIGLLVVEGFKVSSDLSY